MIALALAQLDYANKVCPFQQIGCTWVRQHQIVWIARLCYYSNGKVTGSIPTTADAYLIKAVKSASHALHITKSFHLKNSFCLMSSAEKHEDVNPCRTDRCILKDTACWLVRVRCKMWPRSRSKHGKNLHLYDWCCDPLTIEMRKYHAARKKTAQRHRADCERRGVFMSRCGCRRGASVNTKLHDCTRSQSLWKNIMFLIWSQSPG